MGGVGGRQIGTSKGGEAGRYIETQPDRQMVRWASGWVGGRSVGRTGK